jgi:hypothetical protein
MRRRPYHSLVLFFPGRLDALGQYRKSVSSTHTDDDHYEAARAYDHDHYEAARARAYDHDHGHGHDYDYDYDYDYDPDHDHDHDTFLSRAQSMVPTLGRRRWRESLGHLDLQLGDNFKIDEVETLVQNTESHASNLEAWSTTRDRSRHARVRITPPWR